MTDQPKTEAPGVEGSPQGEGARQDALRGRPSPPESVEQELERYGALIAAVAQAVRNDYPLAELNAAQEALGDFVRTALEERDVWKRSSDACTQAAGQLDRERRAAEAERDRLREALRPFAEYARVYEGVGEKHGYTDSKLVKRSFAPPGGISVGDFRRARRLLSGGTDG